MGKTSAVFTETGAKVNSECYCVRGYVPIYYNYNYLWLTLPFLALAIYDL